MPTPPQQLALDFTRDLRGPKCKRCGAPVRKHYDQTGERIALDVAPSETGNYWLQWDGGEEWATKAPPPPPGTTRVMHYAAHDATCPAMRAEKPDADFDGVVTRNTFHGREVTTRSEHFTRTEKAEMRAEYAAGVSVADIARKRKVAYTRVRNLVRGKGSTASEEHRAAIAAQRAAVYDDYAKGFTVPEIAEKMSWAETQARKLLNKHDDPPALIKLHKEALFQRKRAEALAAKRAARGTSKRGTSVRSSQRPG